MKPTTAQPDMVNPPQNPWLSAADQANVLVKLCKLAELEEEFHGKASPLTERKARVAHTKLVKLMDDLKG